MITQLRFASRQLLQSPGFAAIAILTLALGIGLSASSFSMANALLLRNVPYPDADRLVRIFGTTPQSASRPHSPANLLDLRDTASSFTGIAIFNGDSFALGDPGRPAEQVFGMTASANFLDVLGIRAALGRGFAAGEDQPAAEKVVVLSHRAWTRRYAADPAILGRTVRLNSQPHTVIGVLPPEFHAPLVWGPAEFLIPRIIEAHFRTERDRPWMQAVGRLQPDVSLAAAGRELDALAAGLARQYPKENAGLGLRAVTLHDSNMDGASRSLLWLMTGLSVTMLLIACANLASLQVARAFGRSREYAVRAALGGSRRQLMGPLVAESLLLAALGGGLSLFVAAWSNDLVGSFLRINNEPGFAIPIDGRVLAFAVAASLLSGIAFGLAPAWLASRAPAAEALKEGSRSSTGGPSHQRLKNGLIVGELALAVALVGVATSFGLGARAFLHRSVGWEIDGLYAGYYVLAYNRYPDDDRCREFNRDLLARLQTLPGVEHAVLTTCLPAYSIGHPNRFVVEGQPHPEPGREPVFEMGMVTPDYFRALRIPLREGAFFSPDLTADGPPVAIINETFARRFWPGASAIGRRVRIEGTDRWLEIVGVTGDVRMAVRLDQPETRLHLYRPLIQANSHYIAIILRTAVPPASVARMVREAVAEIDPDLPVARGGSLRAELDDNLANLNLVIVNLGISAGMGLLIAGVGLFGVISQLTAQRTRDIGVRIALGATRRDVMQLVLGHGLRMLAWGVVAGVPAFYGLNLILRRALPEMPLPGPWLLAVNLAVLAGTMFLACYLPARKATRVNPVDALRAE